MMLLQNEMKKKGQIASLSFLTTDPTPTENVLFISGWQLQEPVKQAIFTSTHHSCVCIIYYHIHTLDKQNQNQQNPNPTNQSKAKKKTQIPKYPDKEAILEWHLNHEMHAQQCAICSVRHSAKNSSVRIRIRQTQLPIVVHDSSQCVSHILFNYKFSICLCCPDCTRETKYVGQQL